MNTFVLQKYSLFSPAMNSWSHYMPPQHSVTLVVDSLNVVMFINTPHACLERLELDQQNVEMSKLKGLTRGDTLGIRFQRNKDLPIKIQCKFTSAEDCTRASELLAMFFECKGIKGNNENTLNLRVTQFQNFQNEGMFISENATFPLQQTSVTPLMSKMSSSQLAEQRVPDRQPFQPAIQRGFYTQVPVNQHGLSYTSGLNAFATQQPPRKTIPSTSQQLSLPAREQPSKSISDRNHLDSNTNFPSLLSDMTDEELMEAIKQILTTDMEDIRNVMERMEKFVDILYK